MLVPARIVAIRRRSDWEIEVHIGRNASVEVLGICLSLVAQISISILI